MTDDTQYIPYEKPLVDAVDSIIKMANQNGSKGFIKTSKDWETVSYIFQLWKTLYQEEFEHFKQAIEYFREYEESAVAKENTAMVEHQMEIPPHFYNLVKVIFREQNWDKPFLKELVNQIPQLSTK